MCKIIFSRTSSHRIVLLCMALFGLALPGREAAAQIIPAKPTMPVGPGMVLQSPAVLVIQGRVISEVGQGVKFAEINWADSAPPPKPGEKEPADEYLESFRRYLAAHFSGPAGRQKPGEDGHPTCEFVANVYGRRPLAVSGPDGVYTIELPTMGDAQACRVLIDSVDLKSLPPMVATKAGYTFQANAPKPGDRSPSSWNPGDQKK